MAERLNLGLVAHVDAGKTTLTEQLLYVSGSIRQLGRVDEGNTQTDYLAVERSRGISVRSACTVLHWKGLQINLVDTPGHVDFLSEVERALRVLDAAILVVSAAEGVQSQTEVLWQALSALGIPTLLFVNKIDRMGADPEAVLSEIAARLSPDALPLQRVEHAGSEAAAIGDLRLPTHPGHAAWVEDLAATDEALLTAYLAQGGLSEEALHTALQEGVRARRLFPVLFGRAARGLGVEALLDAVQAYLPRAGGDPQAPPAGVVFGVEQHPTLGRVAHVRLYAGRLHNRDLVINATQGRSDKLTQIRAIHGARQVDTGLLEAGDIAALAGLPTARVGDLLGDAAAVPAGYALATPLLTVRAFPVKEEQLPQLVEAMDILSAEDPLLSAEWVPGERALHLKVTGLIQLEVYQHTLEERFQLLCRFSEPVVLYQETPTQAGIGSVAYTMPKPCWAVLRFAIEPLPRGSGVVYENAVTDNDAILPRYQAQVPKALPGSLRQGPLGWEVTDLKITLLSGESHHVHTHPLDFLVATPMAIMDGLLNCGTTLLEPMLALRLTFPAECLGRVMGLLIRARGECGAPSHRGDTVTLEAQAPVATTLTLPMQLAALTGGRAVLGSRFSHWQPCPLELGASTPYRGVNPADRARYILWARSALQA